MLKLSSFFSRSSNFFRTIFISLNKYLIFFIFFIFFIFSILVTYQKQYNSHQHHQYHIKPHWFRLFLGLLQLFLQPSRKSLSIHKLLSRFHILCSYLGQRPLQGRIRLLHTGDISLKLFVPLKFLSISYSIYKYNTLSNLTNPSN